MSNSSPIRKLPPTVLHGTAKLDVVNQSEIQSEVIQSKAPSSDIQAFCELIARIMMRCLREKNPQVMQLLSVSSQQGLETGEPHDAA